jgi:prepilin-type processing-associated H-X9-DG protein
MLVVVVIIMILVGLLLPVIKGARARGRDVLCKNNLKQLQVGAMTFAVSGDGDLPYSKSVEKWDTLPCPHGNANTWRLDDSGWIAWFNYTCHHDTGNFNAANTLPGEVNWWGGRGLQCITNGSIWAYVKSTKAYSCPEWLLPGVCGSKDPKGGTLTFNSTNNAPWFCYAMNSQVSGVNIGTIEGSKYLMFTEVGNTNWLGATQISERNMMTDLSGKSARAEWAAWDSSFTCTLVAGQAYPYENIGLYHNKKANAVFVDGHIEVLTWQVTTNAAAGRW